MPEYYRPELKRRSKEQLRAASPNVYLTALVFLLLNGLPGFIMQYELYRRLMLYAGDIDRMYGIYQQWAISNSNTGLQLAMLAMNIFLSVLSFGLICYCIRVSRGELTGGVATLFSGFAQFWRVVSLYLLMGIFIFLWSLLLVIPGFIKACAYSQAPYIMLDNPDMSALECIRQSKEMMRGYKGDWFILQLSFIGWYLLIPFTFGILYIWLIPYVETANAGFYNGLIRWQPMAAEPEEPDRPHVDDYWKN